MWRLSQRACEELHIEDVDRLAKRAAIDRGEARRLESIPGRPRPIRGNSPSELGANEV